MQFEYCADAIALYDGKLLLVERLSFPQGYALPGGRRDYIDGVLEDAFSCATRETFEETGLDLIVERVVGTYNAVGRDPRGPKESTVVYGTVSGDLRSEEGKTRAFLMDLCDLDENKDRFAFDHYDIIREWRNDLGSVS